MSKLLREWQPKSARPLDGGDEYRPASARSLDAGSDEIDDGYQMGAAAEDGPKGPGALEAALRGGAQGVTRGFSDEIAGAGSALLDKLKGDDRSFHDLYEAERDDSRAKNAAAEKAHGFAYGAGKFAGDLGSTAALAAATGGTSLGALAAQGAIAGGLQGLGESDSKDAGGDLGNAALGAGIGGAGGLLGALGGRAAGAALRKISPELAEKLDALAISQGRKAINGGANTIGTKNDITNEAVREVLERGGIKAGDDVAKIAERIQGIRDQLGDHAGQIVQGIENEGVQGPAVHGLAQPWEEKAAELEANTINSNVPKEYADAAESLRGKPTFDNGNLKLSQAVNMKRQLQDEASSEYTRLGGHDLLGKAKMDLAGDLRNTLEQHVGDAGRTAENYLAMGGMDPEEAARMARISELAKEYAPTNASLHNIIGASDAANKGAVQAGKRATFGIRNAMVAGPALAAAVSTGNPLPLLAPVAQHLAATRGASTVAAASHSLSKALGKVGAAAATDPARLGQFGGVLASALARGKADFNATHFVLSSNPEYQKTVKGLEDGPESAE